MKSNLHILILVGRVHAENAHIRHIPEASYLYLEVIMRWARLCRSRGSMINRYGDGCKIRIERDGSMVGGSSSGFGSRHTKKART
jgi:hypothetical protein